MISWVIYCHIQLMSTYYTVFISRVWCQGTINQILFYIYCIAAVATNDLIATVISTMWTIQSNICKQARPYIETGDLLNLALISNSMPAIKDYWLLYN